MGLASVLLRSSLLVCVGLMVLPQSEAALAAMSIDFGTQFIKIGLVKPGVPMEIVLNKESRRKTPNILSIRNGERLFAEAAAALATKYPKSAYQYILTLLAKQQGDPAVELYQKRFPFASISFDERRQTVTFPSESETYNVETLLAMILWNAKETAKAYAEQSVKDVVITVPSFLSQAERRALVAAADIAGLNLLQLLSDGSAAALNYGVFRRKEITEKPQTMLIYDMGASKTTATIVEYVLEAEKNSKEKNPVVRTIGVGFDRTLGGLEITQRMTKHLEEVFRKTVKTPTDIATNARSMAKLAKEAERVKQVLSANKDTFAQIENVHEEQNFRAKVTREELEEMIKDLEPRFSKPITDALAMAELTIDKVDQVVMMGAGTRVPKVQEILTKTIGDKELGRFLNTDEAIALGAVYQAAHLSKSFKVLPFGVQELVLYPVQVNFTTKTESGDMKDTSRVVFGYKSHFPTSKKTVNFQSYQDDFQVTVNYGSLAHLNDDQLGNIGATNLQTIAVKGVADAIKKEVVDENCELKGVKTTFSIDLSGIVEVVKSEVHVEKKPSAEDLSKYEEDKKAFEEYETEVKKEKEEKKKADEERKKKEKEAKNETDEATKSEEKEEEKKEEVKENEEEKKEEKPKRVKVPKPTEPKPKTIKVALEVTTTITDLEQISAEEITAAKKILSDYEKAEKEKLEREEAMNALEALVYDLPIKLEEGEEFSQYVTAEEKENIEKEVQRLRTWLEDDVSFETKTAEFVDNKKILDKLTAPAKKRIKHRMEMPKAVEALDQMFNHSRVFFETAKNLTEIEDPVFTTTELEVLEKLIQSTEEWWKEKQDLYVKQSKNEDVTVTPQDVYEKARDLDREVKYLLNKLKSFVPKKKEEPKENKTEEAEPKAEEKEEKKAEETTEETVKTESSEEQQKEHDASEL